MLKTLQCLFTSDEISKTSNYKCWPYSALSRSGLQLCIHCWCSKAKVIVEQYGRSSLAPLTLLNDKSYYFSTSGRSVIAYVPKGRGAIALGDPIGPDDDRKEVIFGFQQFCQHNDWHPAFYQTLPDDLDLYRELGFRVLKIGEEAIADITTVIYSTL
jgi:lysylphosphatidylglycerol synthetase-like protein (DUF2156 family)